MYFIAEDRKQEDLSSFQFQFWHIKYFSLIGNLFVLFQLEYPVLWTCKEFCEEFSKLLDHLGVDRVRISPCKSVHNLKNVKIKTLEIIM